MFGVVKPKCFVSTIPWKLQGFKQEVAVSCCLALISEPWDKVPSSSNFRLYNNQKLELLTPFQLLNITTVSIIIILAAVKIKIRATKIKVMLISLATT